MNTIRILKHSLGIVALVVSLITYTLTVQPTVPFWDCGEFSAATAEQQVPHPPGAPLFLMVGKLFHMVPVGDPAVRINMVSVVASAVTIWLLYFIIIMCIQLLRKRDLDSVADAVSVYGSAFVGAIAFSFSDTFWFNAVESEVYASSSLFVAIVVYLMMRWNEEADQPGHERYLLLIAYLIGLSTGVHLLSVLCIFSIGLLVYFRKYSFTIRSLIIMGALTLVSFAIVYPGVVKYFPALLAGNLPLKNEAHEYYVENEGWVIVLGYLILISTLVGLVYGYRRKKSLMALTCASFCVMFLGYTTYTQILIRSNANPPMNENAPKTFHSLISYLGREQYGDAPMFPRRYERDPEKIEAYKKYGPYTPPPTKRVESIKAPGMAYSVPDYGRAKSTSADWRFMFEYQFDHMFLRYFFWNFVGRVSDVQDSEAWSFFTSPKYTEEVNFDNGYASRFPVRFFALPLIFGLLGLYFHFKRDWRVALIFLVMFLVMGIVAAFAQNQQEPQPRERDYFYTGAFMVWCLWIGIGAFSLVDNFSKKFNNSIIPFAIILGSIVLVPLNMAVGGWFIHSRAGNYLPFDYAYNILQSCEKDAIIFTNGDNDTFPLWNLQDVYGVRRDIRIVNLSLAGTLWYIYDLKHLAPWGAKPIPLSFADTSLVVDELGEGALSTKTSEVESVEFPVSPTVMQKFSSNADTLNNFRMKWRFTGYSRGRNQYAYSVAQQVIGDIIKQTRLERPVYFSVTCGYPTSELFCGLGRYCRQEGMAYRICPYEVGEPGEVIDTKIMEQCLLNIKSGDQYSKEFDHGFKFRNLNNPAVFFDDVHRRYVDNYRTLFLRYANYNIAKNNLPATVMILDSMNAIISPDQFPMSYALMNEVASTYRRCGATEQTKMMCQRVIRQCLQLDEKPYLQQKYQQFIERMPPLAIASQAYELMGDFTNARLIVEKIINRGGKDVPGFKIRLSKLMIDEKESAGEYAEAIRIAVDFVNVMKSYNDPNYQPSIESVERKIEELKAEAAKK